MSIPQLRQLLSQGFYEHGLEAQAEFCRDSASKGQFSPEFFVLGSILESLHAAFDERAITPGDVTRITAKYRDVMTRVLDGIESGLPIEQRYRRLEDLIREHLSEND